jgi:large subunit ribosomal protein L29
MEIKEIRGMSFDELEEELDDTREELMRLRFQRHTGELTDHNLLRLTRRKIARILTIMRERRDDDLNDEEGEE